MHPTCLFTALLSALPTTAAATAPPVTIHVAAISIEGLPADLGPALQERLHDQLDKLAVVLVGELPAPATAMIDLSTPEDILSALDGARADGVLTLRAMRFGPTVRFGVRAFDGHTGMGLHESSTAYPVDGFPVEADLSQDLALALSRVASARAKRLAASPPEPVAHVDTTAPAKPTVEPAEVPAVADPVADGSARPVQKPVVATEESQVLLWTGVGLAGAGTLLGLGSIAAFGVSQATMDEASGYLRTYEGTSYPSDPVAAKELEQQAGTAHLVGVGLIAVGGLVVAGGAGLVAWNLIGE